MGLSHQGGVAQPLNTAGSFALAAMGPRVNAGMDGGKKGRTLTASGRWMIDKHPSENVTSGWKGKVMADQRFARGSMDSCTLDM